jgi:Ala-tRNA(Pro) deacylase
MKNDITQFLDNQKIEYRWLNHPAVHTVSDLNSLPEDIQPIKNLFVHEVRGGRKFLVVMAGNVRLDLNSIRKQLDVKRMCFANDETLWHTFRVKPGAVSIFGFLNNASAGVEVLIDEVMLNSYSELGFHPNDNTATILFAPQELEKVLTNMGCHYTIMKLY